MADGDKHWVPPWRVPPPANQRVMVQFGATFFDAFYCRWRKQWFMMVPGGGEEKIEVPPMWFCAEAYEREHTIPGAEPPPQPVKNALRVRRSRKPEQLKLI